MSKSNEKDTPLFSEFPPISTEEWEKVIQRDLKGADYKEKLCWNTGEGVQVLPFYRQEDLEALEMPSHPPMPHTTKNEWEIRQIVYDQDIDKAHISVRQALQKGADALQFSYQVLTTAGMLGGDLAGTAIHNQQDFSRLLEDVDLTQVGLHFDSGMASPILLAMLYNTCSSRNIDPSALRASFLFDPYSFIATNGHYPNTEEGFIRQARQMTVFCNSNLTGVRCLGVDAQAYHNAGATIVQELGYALATGNEYLAKLTEAGLTVDEVTPRIHFRLAAGSNYFLEIAKFRALRILWKMIVEAYHPSDPSSHITYVNGQSSRRNKTIYDPHTNMLRTTTEGMGAAIAGCDAVTLEPFDRTYKQPDEFSLRMARNTQIIMKEEAYLNQVTDPASGSYYVEKLTDKIAAAAWACFQEVDQQGGILKTIGDGYLQAAIEKSRQQRNESIARGARVFVGTNKYADTQENRTSQLATDFSAVSLSTSGTAANVSAESLIGSLTEALREGTQAGDLISAVLEPGKQEIQPIRPYRGPQAFEELRMATERHDTTPKVLMLPLGDKRIRKARSSFAANFFGCAGYRIEDPLGFSSLEDAVDAIKEQQPQIVVLCSSDAQYSQLVPQLCRELASLNVKPIAVVAGYPKEEIEQYKSAGIDMFIHRNSNVLQTLKWFHEKLGITS